MFLSSMSLTEKETLCLTHWHQISQVYHIKLALRHITIKLASHEVENCPDKSQLSRCHNSEDASSGRQMLGDNKYVLLAKIIQSAQN